MIDLTIVQEGMENAVRRARERNIIIPTYAQMKNPTLIPDSIKAELAHIGLWDITPRNLFRITWHNEPTAQGGGFGGANYIELPSELTGVGARRRPVVGDWFTPRAPTEGAAGGGRVVPHRRT